MSLDACLFVLSVGGYTPVTARAAPNGVAR